jgi:hypothetical protein
MANGYGEWMNNLSGMTSALGAASPYAQQLASQNAAQMALASQIRSGLPAAVTSGYAPSPVAGGVVGGTYQVPQPTPFTGFADLIAANRAVRLSPQPYPNPPVVSGGVTSNGEQRGEGPSFAPYEGGYGSFGEWWDVMKGLPQFASQFTPAGMARDVYRSGGFDPLLRGIGLDDLAAIPTGAIETGQPTPVGARPQDATQAGIDRIRELSNLDQYWQPSRVIEPTETRQPGIAITQLRSPGEENLANLLAQERINSYSNPQPQPEVYGPPTQAGLLSDQYSQQAYEEQNPQQSPWEEPQWNYNFDTGEWDKI